MAKTSKKLTKSLGPIGKLISIIPDTTELIGKAIDNSRPIIEKNLTVVMKKNRLILSLIM